MATSGPRASPKLKNSLLISLLAGSPTSIIKHLADYWRQVATGFGDTRAGSLRMLVRMLFWENTSRAQTNREQIAQQAIEYITERPPQKHAQTEIVDDWLTEFWGIAEKIGSKDI